LVNNSFTALSYHPGPGCRPRDSGPQGDRPPWLVEVDLLRKGALRDRAKAVRLFQDRLEYRREFAGICVVGATTITAVLSMVANY
jgi:hypothetical protein